MSQKHIIEIEGGPYDGALLDLADSAYEPEPAWLSPWEQSARMFASGIPIYRREDGRYYIRWLELAEEES